MDEKAAHILFRGNFYVFVCEVALMRFFCLYSGSFHSKSVLKKNFEMKCDFSLSLCMTHLILRTASCETISGTSSLI